MADKIKTAPFDAADYINSAEDVAFFLEAAFEGAMEDHDPGVIAEAIGAVARSKGMTEIARSTGKSREQLYKTLSADGNPTLSTLVDVLGSLGLRLSVVPMAKAA
jgi:probable addiction module antidote protein